MCNSLGGYKKILDYSCRFSYAYSVAEKGSKNNSISDFRYRIKI